MEHWALFAQDSLINFVELTVVELMVVELVVVVVLLVLILVVVFEVTVVNVIKVVMDLGSSSLKESKFRRHLRGFFAVLLTQGVTEIWCTSY